MSEINIQDKLSDALTNAIKKMNIFEKTNKIKDICIGFSICGIIIGVFTLYNSYTSIHVIENVKQIRELTKTNTDKISDISQHFLSTNKKIDKISQLLDVIKNNGYNINNITVCESEINNDSNDSNKTRTSDDTDEDYEICDFYVNIEKSDFYCNDNTLYTNNLTHNI